MRRPPLPATSLTTSSFPPLPPFPSLLLHSLLLSFLLLLSSLPSSLSDDCLSCLTFTRITDASPWTRRAGATLYLYPFPLRYLNSSHASEFPAHSLLFFGGDWGAADSPHNDVWLSSDRGAHWHLIAGNASTGRPDEAAPRPYDRSSFDPFHSTTTAVSALRGEGYNDSLPHFRNESLLIAKVGGQTQNLRDASDVWTTRDFLNWHREDLYDNPSHFTRASAVISSQGVIFFMGGQLNDLFVRRASAEVWKSDDEGNTWSCITTSAPWGPRSSHSSVLLTGSQTPGVDGHDVVLVVGGTDGQTLFNDVWASSDDCVTWVRLTDAAAFSARQSFSLLATAEGVLLLIAGVDAFSSLNSIYASFDGGYTWHGFRPRNSADALPPRHSHAAALDQNGTLYVAGGITQSNEYIPDLLRSSMSMSNLTAMQLVFGVEVSKCGTGLYCMDDNVIVRGDGRVYCGRCSSDDAIDTTAFILVIVGVVLMFAAFITWRLTRKIKTEHPVGLNEHLVNQEEEDE